MSSPRTFASDNYAGVHPEILAALSHANEGHVSSYGADQYTAELQELVRATFGANARAFPVFNGTGANVIALQSLLPRYGAVLCAETAHVNVDESTAPERVGGFKLLTIASQDGKLTPELLRQRTVRQGDEHYAQPLAVSLTQATELGTVYTVAELAALSSEAHRLGMQVHVDGSRLANAASALGASFAQLTSELDVDILSFGGTKNGLLFGELIIDFTGNEQLKYLVKSNMQLASKARFISAQFLALLGTDLWHRNASHANAMASRLRGAVEGAPGVEFTQDTQANAVFATLPAGVADTVRHDFGFYDWDENRGEVRWMCSFDTTESDIDAFAAAIRQALN